MLATTNQIRTQSKSLTNRFAKWSTLFVTVSLVALVLFQTHVSSNSVKSKAAITVQAAGRGKPYLNFQDGRRMVVNYRGAENATRALQSGQARARALASVDLDGNATPDLVVGYAYNGGGIVTIQRGNPDAFAPKDDSVFVRMQQGYNPDALLPQAETYQVPEPVDFVLAGDFNHDNRKDVLVGTRGGDLFLLAGDGQGGLSAAEQISLPGTVTTMAAGEFRVFDGQPDVAVGVNGPNGPKLLVYDGADGGVTGTPMEFALAGEASVIQFGQMDKDPFMDITVAAGSEIEIVHGWGRKFSPALQSQIERVNAPSEVRGMAIGHFVWDREGRNEIAALSADGTVSVFQPNSLDTTPFNDSEIFARSRNNQRARTFTEDIEAVPGWKASGSESWTASRTVATSVVAGDASPQYLLTSTNISNRETDDLLVAGGRSELNIVRQIDRQTDAKNASQAAALSTTGDMAEISLSSVDAPIAVLPLPRKLNGERSIVVLQSQSAQPTIVPISPTATIVVDRGDDSAAAGAALCTGAANDCSLRGAITFANANAGTVITLPDPTTLANSPAAAYVLSINGSGGCDGNTVGDLDINVNTTINGAGAATTIIRQSGTGGTGGDRVICMNVTGALNIAISLSGLTITGGRDLTNIGGGGIVGGAKGNSLTLTNVTISNNQCTGVANHEGGGLSWTGGGVTLTTCSIGGTSAPGANRTILAQANSDGTSGGGVGFNPGSPFGGQAGATGNLTVTGTTFNHNTAASASAGGGGLVLLATNTGTGSATISGSNFTNNQATVQSGGALNIESTIGTTIDTTSFTNNFANNKGGGIFHGGSGITLSLDGTSPSISFSGNSVGVLATSGGSSISTKALTSLSGTNITIGGSIEVTTGGTWNSNGGTYNLSDVNVLSGAFNANSSTMTISGNLQVVPENPPGTPGASFDGGTGTVNLQGLLTVNGGGSSSTVFNGNAGNFNFTGSNVQSINASSAPTFNFHNLTVNKASNTLTANASAGVVGGDLTVTSGTFDLLGNTFNRSAAGGTLTVSNGATLKIGGTNTLPSNFSTHSIGATSTIEYEGTSQTVATLNSSQKYGHLIISGSGTKTLQGAISVATDLTINGGTLDASASNFNIDDAGNWTNNVAAGNFNPRAATVTFSSGAQNINGTAASQTFNNITVNDTSLTVGGSTTTLGLNGTMLISAGTFVAGTAANINIAGNWTNNVGPAAFTPGTGTVTFNSTTAGQTIGGSAASQTFNNLTESKSGQILNTGGSTTQLDLNGGFNLSAGTFTAPANTNVAGDWTEATGTTFTPGAGTVTFNSTGARNLNGTATTQTFNNLVFNKSGGGSVTGGGSTTTLTINGGVTLTAGTFTAGTVTAIGMTTGDWTNNGGTFTPSSSVVSFTNTVGAQNINGSAATQTFNSITVAKTAQTLSVGGSTTTLTLNGSMTLTSGTFDKGTATAINVAGDWTNNGGTFTNGSAGTVTFNGGGAQNLNGSAATQTFNNFTVSKGGGTLTGGGSTTTLTLTGNFSITAGTFAAGTITTINDPGNWGNAGTFTAGSSTVNLTGNNNTQTLTGTTSFNNLTSNHTGTGGVTASGSTLTVTGLLRIQSGTFTSSSTFANVQIDSGTTLASDGSTMNVSGNWTNNGGTFTPSGNTVNFNGGGAQAINGTAASQTFFNFTVNKGGGTLSTGGSTTSLTTNNLTMTLGSFTAPATLNINGNLLLTAGTLTAGTNTNVTGNWINNGATFTAGSNTVTFNGGAGQTIGGTTATTFNNLTNSDVGGISMTNDNTVNGVLALTSSDITVAATKTLTQPLAGSSSGTFDVNGRVQRTGFVTGGAALSFGNPFNTIQVTAGTAPANIVVDLARSAPTGAQGFPTAINRTYTITPSAGGFTGTLRLHYLVADLNGNDRTQLNLWRFDSGINQWRPNTATRDCDAGCTTNNSQFWAEKTGVTTFSPWTLNSTKLPTAGNAIVSGRVTSSDGQPVAGAVVNLTGAQSRKTITDANGNYRFDTVETNGLYTVTPSRANFSFTPSNRSFNLVGDKTDAVFTGTSTGDHANPLDTAEYFVRQQYVDVLGREPDEAGFNYWSDQLLACGADADCTRARRTSIAAAFFIEQEAQQTGSFIYDVYASALGRKPVFAEYAADRAQVVGGATLDAAKTAFAQSFVARPEFAAKYGSATTADAFVDALLASVQSSGVDLSSERANLINAYNRGADLIASRAAVVRSLADNGAYKQTQYNAAFVLTEYFAYLRRDIDQSGYDFWVNVLSNGEPGNYRGMVCSFITSAEYQRRFSSVVSHTNAECR